MYNFEDSVLFHIMLKKISKKTDLHNSGPFLEPKKELVKYILVDKTIELGMSYNAVAQSAKNIKIVQYHMCV